MRNSKIFIFITSHLLKKLELSRLCRKKNGGKKHWKQFVQRSSYQKVLKKNFYPLHCLTIIIYVEKKTGEKTLETICSKVILSKSAKKKFLSSPLLDDNNFKLVFITILVTKLKIAIAAVRKLSIWPQKCLFLKRS